MTDKIEQAAIADDEACDAAIARIGALERELALIEERKSKAVAEASAAAEQRATPLLEERASLAAGVEAWCEANRARLTRDHATKTANFPSGNVSWVMSRGKVVLDPTRQAKVLERIKQTAKAFIRIKEELDLAAIGKAFREKKAEKLKGIRGLSFQKPAESFVVKPTGAELADRPPAA